MFLLTSFNFQMSKLPSNPPTPPTPRLKNIITPVLCSETTYEQQLDAIPLTFINKLAYIGWHRLIRPKILQPLTPPPMNRYQ